MARVAGSSPVSRSNRKFELNLPPEIYISHNTFCSALGQCESSAAARISVDFCKAAKINEKKTHFELFIILAYLLKYSELSFN